MSKLSRIDPISQGLVLNDGSRPSYVIADKEAFPLAHQYRSLVPYKQVLIDNKVFTKTTLQASNELLEENIFNMITDEKSDKMYLSFHKDDHSFKISNGSKELITKGAYLSVQDDADRYYIVATSRASSFFKSDQNIPFTFYIFRAEKAYDIVLLEFLFMGEYLDQKIKKIYGVEDTFKGKVYYFEEEQAKVKMKNKTQGSL